MRRVRRFVVAAGLVAAFAIAGAVPAGADHAQRADFPIRAVGAILSGANEVPPADGDGFGAAGVLLNTRTGRVCFAIFVKHIEPATVAHIHRGAAGVNGPPVVLLDPPPTSGFSAACVMATPAIAAEIAGNPGGFYVNVHNAEFPNGAVRGQLH
jgi:hypothetical protein